MRFLHFLKGLWVWSVHGQKIFLVCGAAQVEVIVWTRQGVKSLGTQVLEQREAIDSAISFVPSAPVFLVLRDEDGTVPTVQQSRWRFWQKRLWMWWRPTAGDPTLSLSAETKTWAMGRSFSYRVPVLPAVEALQNFLSARRWVVGHYSFLALSLGMYRKAAQSVIGRTATFFVHKEATRWVGLLFSTQTLCYVRQVSCEAEPVDETVRHIQETALYAAQQEGWGASPSIVLWGKTEELDAFQSMKTLTCQPDNDVTPFLHSVLRMHHLFCARLQYVARSVIMKRSVHQVWRYSLLVLGVWGTFDLLSLGFTYQQLSQTQKTHAQEIEHLKTALSHAPISPEICRLWQQKEKLVPLKALRRVAPLLSSSFRLTYASWEKEVRGQQTLTLEMQVRGTQSPNTSFRTFRKRLRTAFPEARLEVLHGRKEDEEEMYADSLSVAKVEEATFVVRLSW